MMIKWEYRIEFCKMPSGFVDRLEKEWTELQANHSEVMNKLGSEGWEYFMNIGPLFYFKRPIKKPDNRQYIDKNFLQGFVKSD